MLFRCFQGCIKLTQGGGFYQVGGEENQIGKRGRGRVKGREGKREGKMEQERENEWKGKREGRKKEKE